MWTWLESLPVAVWGVLLLALIFVLAGVTAYLEIDREKQQKRQQYGARIREIEQLRKRLGHEE